jgi:hypothetical protein
MSSFSAYLSGISNIYLYTNILLFMANVYIQYGVRKLTRIGLEPSIRLCKFYFRNYLQKDLLVSKTPYNIRNTGAKDGVKCRLCPIGFWPAILSLTAVWHQITDSHYTPVKNISWAPVEHSTLYILK